MHFRLSLWTALMAFVVTAVFAAQTPAATLGDIKDPGQIVAKKVTGIVNITVNGQTVALHDNDAVVEHSSVRTMPDSSVILVFSNGATTQLGADTSLDIDQFVQDPFSSTISIGGLAAEPTRSKTKLHLTKGELVGHVAKLNHEQGSEYTIETPVGAAGIRGTTYKIMFIPGGKGQAFAKFSLSTLEGHVQFNQGQQGGNGQPGGPNAPGGAPGPGQEAPAQGQGGQGSPTAAQGPSAPSAPGTPAPPSGGVAVTSGQEVTLTVPITVNTQTNAIVVTAPPPPPVAHEMPPETKAQITTQANNAISTGSQVSFTAPAPTTPASTPTTTSTDKKDDSGDKKDTGDAKKDGGTSGNGNGGTADNAPSNPASTTTPSTATPADTPATTNSNGSTAAPASNPSSNTVQTQVTVKPATPPVTTPLPALTPGAGGG